MRVKNSPDAIFQSVRSASEITGLSMKYIRAGCRNNTIPHIMCGVDVRVNMPLFLERLNEESRRAAHDEN